LPRRCHGASRSEYANLAVPSALISRLCAIADLSFLFSRFRLLYQNLWVLSSLSEKTRLDNFIRKRGGMQQQLLDMTKVHTLRSLRRFHPATYDSRCPRKPPRSPVRAFAHSGCGIMRGSCARRFEGFGKVGCWLELFARLVRVLRYDASGILPPSATPHERLDYITPTCYTYLYEQLTSTSKKARITSTKPILFR
jgi:hypothetical protein